MTAAHTNGLSPARHRLVLLMSGIGFGHIDGLRVKAGEPVFDPPPEVMREVKFGSDATGPPPGRPEDFALKRQVVELLEHLDRLGDADIVRLEVRHGLPFRMMLGARARA